MLTHVNSLVYLLYPCYVLLLPLHNFRPGAQCVKYLVSKYFIIIYPLALVVKTNASVVLVCNGHNCEVLS